MKPGKSPSQEKDSAAVDRTFSSNQEKQVEQLPLEQIQAPELLETPPIRESAKKPIIQRASKNALVQEPLGRITDPQQALETPLSPQAVPAEPPVANTSEGPSADSKSMWVWAGAGMGFFAFNQNDTENAAQTNYSSMSSPTYAFGMGLQFSETSKIEACFQRSPVEIKGVNASQVSTSRSQWTSLSLEVTTGIYQNFSILYGLESASLPWFSARNDQTFEQLQVNTYNASIGLGIDLSNFNNVYFSAQLRYHHPLLTSASSAGSLSLENSRILQGQVNAYYKIRKYFDVGLVWTGQSNSFDYAYNDHRGNKSKGSQKMMLSNLQLRLKYSF